MFHDSIVRQQEHLKEAALEIDVKGLMRGVQTWGAYGSSNSDVPDVLLLQNSALAPVDMAKPQTSQWADIVWQP